MLEMVKEKERQMLYGANVCDRKKERWKERKTYNFNGEIWFQREILRKCERECVYEKEREG